MPFPGNVWRSGTWTEDSWRANTWADAQAAILASADVIVRVQADDYIVTVPADDCVVYVPADEPSILP